MLLHVREQYALIEGTKRGGGGGWGVNVGHSLSPSPPSHFMLGTGLGDVRGRCLIYWRLKY